ncbi:unnamed protein product [Acanthoscelides obtectus]|uniref:Uncharacterized protein n=1 Tax=Acanthoscelides obtectus TaxID=200917 RepID=A0A9P0P3V4_ACAOB|nr:unnamed protein product [Acanthoscelides obtectus]CAK1631628.1 hypothetical protein AOBTE_LOCUS7061 [Acanthoscelides obtectus]
MPISRKPLIFDPQLMGINLSQITCRITTFREEVEFPVYRCTFQHNISSSFRG